MIKLSKHNLFHPRWAWSATDIKKVLAELGPGKTLHVCSGGSGIGDIRLDRRLIDGRLLHKGFKLQHSGTPNVLGNMISLPFKAASFDLVVIDPPYDPAWILNSVYKKMLEEVSRVVKPGGKIIIIAQYIFCFKTWDLQKTDIYETGKNNFYYKVLAIYRKFNTQISDFEGGPSE